MRQSTSRAIATITTLAFLFLPLPAVAASKSAAQTQYAVVSLGVLDNAGSSTVLRRTNSRGEVVGGYRQGGRSETAGAFLLSSTGILFLTDQQKTDYSAAYGINDSGEIAGTMNGANSILPFRSVRHDQFQLLSLLAGDTAGAAYGINKNGEAVGFTSGSNGIHAVWWTRTGQVTQLPTLANGGTVKAVAINAKGDIAGTRATGKQLRFAGPVRAARSSSATLPASPAAGRRASTAAATLSARPPTWRRSPPGCMRRSGRRAPPTPKTLGSSWEAPIAGPVTSTTTTGLSGLVTPAKATALSCGPRAPGCWT